VVRGSNFFDALKNYISNFFFGAKFGPIQTEAFMTWFSSHLFGKYFLFPCIVTDLSFTLDGL
jgi:hypothetical protein